MDNSIRGSGSIKDLARVRAIFLDCDGVLTDNTEGYLPGQGVIKTRSYYDGQGVSFMRAVGIKVVVITGEKDQSAELITTLVGKWNTLPSSKSPKGLPPNPNGWEDVVLHKGCRGEQKAEKLREWLGEIGVDYYDTFGVGDDIADYHALMMCGLRGCPISGESYIKSICHFISERPGGRGAFRDFANWILEAKGVDPSTLPPA